MRIKAPENKEGEVAEKVLYTCNKPTPAKPKTTRFIPSAATKILDAPDIINDFYLNLLDWGSGGLIVIALGGSVYLWNSTSGSVVDLFSDTSTENTEDVVTSVKWITAGEHIAVGLNTGVGQLWDTSSLTKVRSMGGHSCRVGCLAWNSHMLSSGAKNGNIHQHDVRIADHHTSTFDSHSEEVCGMEWNSDGNYLASGANDNLLNVWDKRKIVEGLQTPNVVDTPVMTMAAHSAAVKAVSWCPWQRHILASGGGIGDRQMRLWTTNRGVGTCLQSIDLMAQVSDILWSGTYQEIMCSYGNNLGIWKHSTMNKEAELTGHSERVLSMTMSPDGEHVASVGADETLRLWKAFEPPVVKKKTSASASALKKNANTMSSMHSIR
jgi:cell division cycle protein 20 (cofactor of APC complex)